jgi:hypothetical protein
MADDIRRYSPPQSPVTVTAMEHEDGPTGAVPPPPKSVTTASYPNAALGEGEEAPDAPATKAVKPADVDDKAVTSAKSSTKGRS